MYGFSPRHDLGLFVCLFVCLSPATGSETDYQTTVRAVTISPSSSTTREVVLIPIIDDPYVERRERIEVFINLAIADMAVIFGTRRASVNIIDNDGTWPS